MIIHKLLSLLTVIYLLQYLAELDSRYLTDQSYHHAITFKNEEPRVIYYIAPLELANLMSAAKIHSGWV